MVVGRSGLTIDLQNFELHKHAQSDEHAQSTNDQQTKAYVVALFLRAIDGSSRSGLTNDLQSAAARVNYATRT